MKSSLPDPCLSLCSDSDCHMKRSSLHWNDYHSIGHQLNVEIIMTQLLAYSSSKATYWMYISEFRIYFLCWIIVLFTETSRNRNKGCYFGKRQIMFTEGRSYNWEAFTWERIVSHCIRPRKAQLYHYLPKFCQQSRQFIHRILAEEMLLRRHLSAIMSKIRNFCWRQQILDPHRVSIVGAFHREFRIR